MNSKIIKVRSQDNHFQHVEAIRRTREKRKQYGKFFVEGVAAINLAIRYGWVLDTLIFSSARTQSSWANRILETSASKQILDLSPELHAALSDKSEPSEILALVVMRPTNLDEILPSDKGLLVLCDRPTSPGNLGTIIRSADAFGADAVIISGHAVDSHDPQVIRASVGTFFARPVIRIESASDLTTWVDLTRERGLHYRCIGTSAKGIQNCSDADLRGPMVLLMGNETTGLSRAYIAASEILLKIPIDGAASSLNVGCATSIMLYEINRQRSQLAQTLL